MSIRMGRVGSEMQKSLTSIIGSKVKDPKITGMVSVTQVECASDLKTAKVFISNLGDDKQEVVAALNNSASFIRSELAKDLRNLRTVPQLTFFVDHSLEQGNKIDSILDSLKKEGEL